MPNVFRRSRLHNQHNQMMANVKDRPAHHELASAKITRKRNSRTTPNRRQMNSIGIGTLDGILAGDTLRICIARSLGGIGDVLMTTPLVKALKLRYPNSIITYATDPAYAAGALMGVLEHNPYIDKVIPFVDVRQKDYHLYADVTSVGLARERRNFLPVNRIDMFAEYVGIKLDDFVPTYVVTEEERAWAKAKITKWTKGRTCKTITVHISSVDERRNWPTKNFIELVAQTTTKHPNLFFIIFDQHRRGAWGLKNTIDASDFDIRAKAALIDASALFLGPDSALLHLAGALDKEIVSLFGSSHPAARINHYPNAIAVESTILCRRCWYSTCLLNHACMSNIRIIDVIQAIENKLIASTSIATSLGNKIIVGSYEQPTYYSHPLEDSLFNIINLSSTPVVRGSEKTIETMQDYWLECINMSDEKIRRSLRNPSVGYVIAGQTKISADKVKKLNTYKALLVPSNYVKILLRNNSIKTKIKVCPLPIKVEPKPYQHKSSADTMVFGTVVDTLEDNCLDNIKIIYEAFAEASENDIDKRLHILVARKYMSDIKTYVETISDMRIKIIEFCGKTDLTKFLSTIDCYVESHPHDITQYYTLLALAQGLEAISYLGRGPNTICSIPNDIVTRVKSKTYLGQFSFVPKELVKALIAFTKTTEKSQANIVNKIKYIQDEHNAKAIAHVIINTVREDMNG